MVKVINQYNTLGRNTKVLNFQPNRQNRQYSGLYKPYENDKSTSNTETSELVGKVFLSGMLSSLSKLKQRIKK